jgi:small subunit ribosomal protein S34
MCRTAKYSLPPDHWQHIRCFRLLTPLANTEEYIKRMPYKYIGRRTDFRGKTLWEIVGNLKNFGIGRIVVRSRFERYQEPSYLKIVKVEPLPCPEVQNMDNQRKVRVLVEKTFRGKTFPNPITIESASYKTDYRLLATDEEKAYCKMVELKSELPIYPKTMDFPPLLKELLIKEKKAKGEVLEELKLDVVYQKKNNGTYRIANEGEEPTISFNVNPEKLPDISLYKNIKFSTEH